MTVTKCRPPRISGKYAVNWTRLSCHDFVDNQVRLQLFALVYDLGGPGIRTKFLSTTYFFLKVTGILLKSETTVTEITLF